MYIFDKLSLVLPLLVLGDHQVPTLEVAPHSSALTDAGGDVVAWCGGGVDLRTNDSLHREAQSGNTPRQESSQPLLIDPQGNRDIQWHQIDVETDFRQVQSLLTEAEQGRRNSVTGIVAHPQKPILMIPVLLVCPGQPQVQLPVVQQSETEVEREGGDVAQIVGGDVGCPLQGPVRVLASDNSAKVVLGVVHLEAGVAKLGVDLQDPWHLVSAELRDLDRFIGGEGELEDHVHELRGGRFQGSSRILGLWRRGTCFIIQLVDDGVEGLGCEVEGVASFPPR
jgi:hypothetical protein